MKPLLAALQSSFTTVASHFPGGLWLDQAPEGQAMPYVIVTVIVAPLTCAYGGARWSDPTVQFAAYGNDCDGLGDGMAALCGALDDTILTLAAGQMFDARRLDEPRPEHVDPPDADGQSIWRWRTSYRFAVRQ